MSTLIQIHFKMHFFLCVLALSTLRQHYCYAKMELFENVKWIHLKTLFLHCNVDCENQLIQKRWRMFSHVTHIVLFEIPLCTGIVSVMCYSNCCWRYVSLYTFLMIVLQKWQKITCNCCPAAKHLRFSANILWWLRATWMRQWIVRYFAT